MIDVEELEVEDDVAEVLAEEAEHGRMLAGEDWRML